jgi:hypothetical protein
MIDGGPTFPHRELNSDGQYEFSPGMTLREFAIFSNIGVDITCRPWYIINMVKGGNEMANTKLSKGDKVKTVYGKIETVMVHNGCQVITYESARENAWYHPTKVWLVK